MKRREGVCQDFAHLMVSALRGLGCRRVTYPAISARSRRRARSGGRALISRTPGLALAGPAHGWVDLDPTNGIVVKDEHVLLGWGRDYGDVSPVRGVILGGGRHSLSVAWIWSRTSTRSETSAEAASMTVLTVVHRTTYRYAKPVTSASTG